MDAFEMGLMRWTDPDSMATLAKYREKRPFRARQDEAGLAFPANLPQALSGCGEQVDDFEPVVPGGLEQLLRDFGGGHRAPRLRHGQLARALQAPPQGLRDPDREGLLLRLIGHGCLEGPSGARHLACIDT